MWFADNKLDVKIGENKAKLIILANKRSTKNICKQTVRDKEVNIKQPIQVL